MLSNARRQVLIEATIAEVQLNNQYQQGIDWSLFRRANPQSSSTSFNINQAPSGTTTATPTGSLIALGLSTSLANNNLTVAVQLLESFGKVRVLSSPRLTVLNNQTAILKVVDNQVIHHSGDNDAGYSGGRDSVHDLHHHAQHRSGRFHHERDAGDRRAPTACCSTCAPAYRVSSATYPIPIRHWPRLAALPAPARGGTACAPIVSNIPVIQTREMESLIKVDSGQIAVMGGLIQDHVNDLQDTVPGVNRLPRRRRNFRKQEQDQLQE